MYKLLSAISFLFIISFAAAQETVDMQMMQKIKDEAKNNSQVAMIAHNLTDVCGPRLTNSPGYSGDCKMPAVRPGANLVKAGKMKRVHWL